VTLCVAPNVAPDSVREFKAQRRALILSDVCAYRAVQKLGAARDAFKLPNGVGSHIRRLFIKRDAERHATKGWALRSVRSLTA